MNAQQYHPVECLYPIADGKVYYRAWLVDLAEAPGSSEAAGSDGSSPSPKTLVNKVNRTGSADDSNSYIKLWDKLDRIENQLAQQLPIWTWWRETFISRSSLQKSSTAGGVATRAPNQLPSTTTTTNPYEERLTLWVFACDDAAKERLKNLVLPFHIVKGPQGEFSYNNVYPRLDHGRAYESVPALEGTYRLFCLAWQKYLTRESCRNLQQQTGHGACPWRGGTALLFSLHITPGSDLSSPTKSWLLLDFHIQMLDTNVYIRASVYSTSLRPLESLSRSAFLSSEAEIVLGSAAWKARLLPGMASDKDQSLEAEAILQNKYKKSSWDYLRVEISSSPSVLQARLSGQTSIRLQALWPIQSCFVDDETWQKLSNNLIQSLALQAEGGDSKHHEIKQEKENNFGAFDLEELDRLFKDPMQQPTPAYSARTMVGSQEGDELIDYDGPGVTEDDFSFFDSAPPPMMAMTTQQVNAASNSLNNRSFVGDSQATLPAEEILDGETVDSTAGMIEGPSTLIGRGTQDYDLNGPAGPTPGKTPGHFVTSPTQISSFQLDAAQGGQTRTSSGNNSNAPTTSDHVPPPSYPHNGPTPNSIPADTPKAAVNELTVGQALESRQPSGPPETELPSVQERETNSKRDSYEALPLDMESQARSLRYRGALQKGEGANIKNFDYKPGIKRRIIEHPTGGKLSQLKIGEVHCRAPLTPESDGLDDQEHEDEDTTGPSSEDESAPNNKLAVHLQHMLGASKSLDSGWPIGLMRPLPVDDHQWIVQAEKWEAGLSRRFLTSLITEILGREIQVQRPPETVTSSCPSIICRRDGDVLQMAANALPFWAPLELAPISGPKDVSGFMLLDRQSQADFPEDYMLDWLEDLGSTYMACNLGRHFAAHTDAAMERSNILKIDFSRFDADDGHLANLEEVLHRFDKAGPSAARQQVVLYLASNGTAEQVNKAQAWLKKVQNRPHSKDLFAMQVIDASSLRLPWNTARRRALAFKVYSHSEDPGNSLPAYFIDPPEPPKLSFETDKHLKSYDVLHQDYMLFVGYHITERTVAVEWIDQRGEINGRLTIPLLERQGLDFRPDYSWMAEVIRALDNVCQSFDLDWHVVLFKHGTMGRKELQDWETKLCSQGSTFLVDGLTIACCASRPLTSLAAPLNVTGSTYYEDQVSLPVMDYSICDRPYLLSPAKEETLPVSMDMPRPQVGLSALASTILTAHSNATRPEARDIYMLLTELHRQKEGDIIGSDELNELPSKNHLEVMKVVMEKQCYLSFATSALGLTPSLGLFLWSDNRVN